MTDDEALTRAAALLRAAAEACRRRATKMRALQGRRLARYPFPEDVEADATSCDAAARAIDRLKAGLP
mgnify:FL=1